jgi:hypothetical protein
VRRELGVVEMHAGREKEEGVTVRIQEGFYLHYG